MNQLKIYNERTFEDIKHIDEDGNEYWEARELQIALEQIDKIAIHQMGLLTTDNRIQKLEDISKAQMIEQNSERIQLC